MSSGIEIRRMTAGELALVAALAARLPEAPHWPEEAYRSAIDCASTPRRIALVAAGANTILGFALASLLPPQAELEAIAVAQENQRQGLGRRLLSAVVAELRAADVRELLLEVRQSNRPALAFYGAHGFVQTGLRPSYYADPIEDAVLMSLTLA